MKKFENRKTWLEGRLNYITSTQLPVLFGIRKYGQSMYGLYQEKAKGLLDDEGDERQAWGQILQEAIAGEVVKQSKWERGVLPEFHLFADDTHRCAASLDAIIKTADGPAVLEIKNVDRLIFDDQWERDDQGNYQAPIHIELQLQHQMLCTGYKKAHLAALVGGNELIQIERVPSEELVKLIHEKVSAFWTRVSAKDEPSLEEDGSDLIHVKRAYMALTGEYMEASTSQDEWACKLKEAQAAKKNADAEVKHYKGLILNEAQNASIVKGGNWRLSRTHVPEKDISYTRKAYVLDRFTFKK